MKRYNYDLAKKIVDKLFELGVLESASLGMHEDWFWTAQTIWEGGEYQVKFLSNKEADKMHSEFMERRKNGLSMFLDEKEENGLSKINPEFKKYDACLFGGILQSDWATPVLQVHFKDGEEKNFNCFIGENEQDILKTISGIMSCTSGVLSAPVQEHRSGTKIEDFNEN